VYEVEVEGEPSEEALQRLVSGIQIDDSLTAPAQVRRLGPGRIELTIHEGRKHQVKRMFEAVGHRALRLHRSGYASLTVNGLAPGESRDLRRGEVEALQRLVRLRS
jgi:23S rRNA pseudouridine2605 synthase